MAISRKNLIDMICYNLGTQNYVLLDEFEAERARHICQGGKQIFLLDKETANMMLPDGSGSLTVEYFLCRNCGKLYLNKDNLTQVVPFEQFNNGYGNDPYGNNPYGNNPYGNGGSILGGFGEGMGGIW